MEPIMKGGALVDFWRLTETAAIVPTQAETQMEIELEIDDKDDGIDWSSLAAIVAEAKRDAYYREGAREGRMSDLIGKVCVHVEQSEDRCGDEQIVFVFDDGTFAKMYHRQSCCESVSIEDVNGDLEDLIGVPLEVFDERVQDDPRASESATWTFYCLRTIRGSIDIRWHGSSNGYYSETADVEVWMPEQPISAHQRLALLKAAQEGGAA